MRRCLFTLPVEQLIKGATFVGIVTNKSTEIFERPAIDAKAVAEVLGKGEVKIIPIKADWYPVLMAHGEICWVEAKTVKVEYR